MNSKIVIFEDSVILYQHFISDDNWETVMAFPRGGLTYLIKNDNIKFFAFIDYFYKNCLMTMDLPLYIVDEELGIDGEYDDFEEITEILNRIFPANTDKDLTLYLKISEAEKTYQHIGTYIDDVEYDSSGKTIDFYSDGTLVDSIDATDFIKDGMVDSVSLIELSGDTYLHIVFNTDSGKEPIDINIGDLFDADNYYTKDEIDEMIPSVPSLSGYATETWVQNQGYINQIKTINNISLVGEGNINIGSGGTIDAYTKDEADERFQPKGEYVTSATFITYIENLQNQIDSLQEAIESCCSGQTGETLYRWITLTGSSDYVCSGTTKYAKEQMQQSTDNGATWQNVSPAEYRTGIQIETESTDCGYKPVIEYRWITVSGEYVCSGTTKYNKEKKQYRVDGGAWQDTNPLETRQGSTVIETESTDCGYIAPQYRWYQATASDYMCSGTTKYYKEYYQVSYDGGNTWANVTPTQTRQGAVIETQSSDCGYAGTKFSAVYSDSRTYSAECDGSEYLSTATTRPSGYTHSAMTEATIGTCNTKIALGAFWSCHSLTSVTIPNTITSIGGNGFYDCKALSSITIPNSVTTIGDNAFGYCRALTSITIPDSVISIGNNAFDDCRALSSVTFGSGLTSIGERAFDSCEALSSVTVYDNVTSIGKRAFESCTALTSCTIGSGITSIGEAVFDMCSGLTSITIYATTPPILENGNLGYPENYIIYVPCDSVDAYKSASDWSYYANQIRPIQGTCWDGKFKATYRGGQIYSEECDGNSELTTATTRQSTYGYEYSAMTSAIIGSCITGIGANAFNKCRVLTSVTIPDSVTTIYQKAFLTCSGLTSVVIPSSITTIEPNAFEDCIGLNSITILATTPPILSSGHISGFNPFAHTNNCPIYVPAESVNAYKSAPTWALNVDRIQAIP